jgi:putative FmdB family regulatory protein
MPIYEYRCESCGAVNEYLVFSKNEEIACKSCNGKDLVKMISAHNTVGSNHQSSTTPHGGCCGSPNSCGNPGSCCSG